MISFPNAKINLGLNILSKREDGYHNIESCFYPIPWHDSLEVIEAASFSFQSYGLDIPGAEQANLCVQAYELLRAAHNIPPVEIHLLKQIPMGAGLGGGSADGAFTLKVLNQIYDLKITSEGLKYYAGQLGSDCPFFIDNLPAIATGTGIDLDIIDLDLSHLHIGVIHPGIHISTQEAYSGTYPNQNRDSIAQLIQEDIGDWDKRLSNDFEKSIFPSQPEIKNLKESFKSKGAIYSSMSGSGSAVFGLFDQIPNSVEFDFFKKIDLS